MEEGIIPVPITANRSSENLWQEKLLPFVLSMLALLTLLFFLFSFYSVYDLHIRTDQGPRLEMAQLTPVIPEANRKTSDNAWTPTNEIELARWNSITALEAHLLRARYHQASILLMSRVLLKQMGFTAGMIMSMVGSIFILAKLRESSSTIQAEGGAGKVAIITASPGLVLALLGTILMGVTIMTHQNITVSDAAVYISAPAPIQVQDEVPRSRDAIFKDIEDKLKKARETK